MFRRMTAMLLSLVLLLSCVGYGAAAQTDGGSFVLVAFSANNTIVEPVRVTYQSGQTVREALAASNIDFVGLEQGYVYEIAGVVANFSLYYDAGGYDLNASAADITALCFHVSGVYSAQAIRLIQRMADYLDMENHVQRYQPAADAYAAALKGLRTADATAADGLLTQLNQAISAYEALLNGEKFTVTASATQNGAALRKPLLTLTDAYGNVTSGTESVRVIAGAYHFCVSDGGYNRTEGTLQVSANAEIAVVLPDGEWFGDIRLLDGNKEPYRYTQDSQTHSAQYWVGDTAKELASIYLNAAMGDVPDTATVKLRTIYVGTDGKDKSTTSRSWNSTASALTYLVTQGMEGRSFSLEAQYADKNGHTQIQSYALTVTRVPTLRALSVTAEGTRLPLAFDPVQAEYTLQTVSSTLEISAEAFGADYTVSGTGTVKLSGSSLQHEIVVEAPNGAQNTYRLRVTKTASVSVRLTVPSGTDAAVYNAAGAQIAPVQGLYQLIPGEDYTCIATKNVWYHTSFSFTAASGLRLTVPEPDATDWLRALALYNGTNASNRIAYEADSDFRSSLHTYHYTVSDCNTTAYIQATADTGSITALYTSQTLLPASHGVQKTVEITMPVSDTGRAQALSQAVARSGVSQTVTVRLSKTEGETTWYQDYTICLLRSLHLTSLSAATAEETLPFVDETGASCKFDRDRTDYTLRVNRETTSLLLSAAVPNASGSTDCCGGYYMLVNGQRYEALEAVELALNTEADREHIAIQVCHKDTDSLPTTYTITVQKTDPIRLTVRTEPAEAVVFLVNLLNGKRVLAQDGAYRLTPGASYAYTVTCAGYVGQRVEAYIAPETDATLTLTLQKAPENSTLVQFDAAWPHLRQNNDNNGVVNYRTPVYAEDTMLSWATKIGEGFDSDACGCPILVNGYLYTYSGKTIYQIDTVSGQILNTASMDHSSSFAINPPTYAAGMIFVGLSDGTVQAFNADTLESLWIYRDPLGGQPNSAIVYHDGYVYTGFWVGETNEANFVCLNASDEDPSQPKEEKLATWFYTSKGGFYWAGAYVCDSYLLVGTDDGASGYTSGKPGLLSFAPKTGELLDSYQMEVTGDIRSAITHYDGKYYFTSKGGCFFEATVSQSGKIEDVRTLRLYNYASDPSNPPMSTCTPTIYNGRAYIGVSGTAQFGAYSGHNLTVIDIPNWEIAYTVRTHGYPQTSGVLTTAYEKNTGCVYVYFFDNFTPGKLRVLEDRPGQTTVSLKTVETYQASGTTQSYDTPYNLFTPDGAQSQYALCSPIIDEYGTIYFKNDSAWLMAVSSTVERLEITKQPDRTSYRVGDTFDAAGMQVTAYYSNGLSRDVTKYVTWSDAKLTADDTDFQISFPYAMYQNRESGDTMEYGVACLEPLTTITLQIEEEAELPYGDLNMDGVINARDVLLLRKYVLGTAQLNQTQCTLADLNGDGTINARDVLLLRQFVLGKITGFPVQD